MHGKWINIGLLLIGIVGCMGTSRYIIQFNEPEKHFTKDRYYVSISKVRTEIYFFERLFFENGTMFWTFTLYNDSTKMPIRKMADQRKDEFIFGEENPQLDYTYEKSYYSSWGRYTIKGDTVFVTELANDHVTPYRLLGWNKKQFKKLIRGDTLLNFDYKTGELIPDSIAYSVYNPQVKLDFMDSRKAWIYRYNEYPDLK